MDSDSNKLDPTHSSTWSLPSDSASDHVFFLNRDHSHDNHMLSEFPWSYDDSSELSHTHSSLGSPTLADMDDYQPSDDTPIISQTEGVAASCSGSQQQQSLVGDQISDVIAPNPSASSSSSEDLGDKRVGKAAISTALADTS